MGAGSERCAGVRGCKGWGCGRINRKIVCRGWVYRGRSDAGVGVGMLRGDGDSIP